jgi:hypothetical protein
VSDAVAAIGATITIGAVPIEEVKDISGPELTLDMVDVTSHDSPNQTEEKKATLKRLGPISFDMNAVPGAAGQQALVDAWDNVTESAYVLTMTNGVVITFSGNVTSIGPSAAVADVNMLAVTIEVATLTSFSYGS